MWSTPAPSMKIPKWWSTGIWSPPASPRICRRSAARASRSWQTARSSQNNVELAIQVKDLRKSYGDVNAVRGIDFEVAAGEVFGLLGPNGAGKTTTVEIL